MTNKLEIFKNEEFGEIRTVIIDGEPWFVAKDISDSLGYRMASDMTRRLDPEDRGTHLTSTPNGTQNMSIINESGLYTAILGSKLDSAKRFKHWITSEILPSIRKHGAYMTNEVIERTITDPDYLIQLAIALKEERKAKELEKQKRELAEQIIEEQKPLVDFANKVSDSSNLIDMGKMAKLLKDEHINIGRNRLFAWLRSKEMLMRNNMPYQKYIESGYFQVKESVYETPYGSKTQQTTYVTGKGQIYITEKLRKEFKTV